MLDRSTEDDNGAERAAYLYPISSSYVREHSASTLETSGYTPFRPGAGFRLLEVPVPDDFKVQSVSLLSYTDCARQDGAVGTVILV